ncbi:MAG: cytochrome c3 family protein [Sulfurimonas sp.]|nr:cytochrome c3 family protein [Sulfurimonas sp.]
MKQHIKKIVAMVLLLLIGTLLFQVYGVSEKFGRFVAIMGNITYNLQNAKHAYEEENFSITEDELNDINITKLAQEFKTSIDRKKEALVLAAVAPPEIRIDEIREEETPTHMKTQAVKAKIVKLEDLPAKFKPLKQYLHEPFKMGACQICHTSKNNNPGELIKKNIADICYECHKTRYTKKFDHTPAKDGKCMDCHDPHQSNTKGLLKENSINALCMKCHDRKSTFSGKAKKQFVDMNLEVKHKPIVEKSCLECHDAHTAEYKSLLSLDAKMDLCLDCHDEVKEKTTHSKFKHGGVNTSEKRCLECHDPHATKHKNLLKKDIVATCLSCHDKEIKSDEDGGMLINMKKHLEENPNWHKPIKDAKKEGGCSACHDPHGSDNFSILRKSFTKNFYADLENKDFFCFKCHTEKKITTQFITTSKEHNITAFRDGEVNLHYLHVNDRKGRSCRACHDEHASKYTHLIRDYTDFNGIKFPLRYIETADGGSCAPACHKKFEYDRVNPKGIGK